MKYLTGSSPLSILLPTLKRMRPVVGPVSCLLLLLTTLSLSTLAAQSAVDPLAQQPRKDGGELGYRNGVGFSVRVGYLYGESHELVMASKEDKFDLESQLTWKIQDALMLSAGFELMWEQLYFKLGVSLPLVLTRAPMENRDWRFDNPPGGGKAFDLPASAPSHYSSSATKNKFSFSTRAIFTVNLLRQNSGSRLEIGASLLYLTWSWLALKTQGLYFLDDQGAFGGYRPLPSKGDTIRYRVHYLAPAVAARFAGKWGSYEIQALLNYSPVSFFFDRDEHLVTSIDSDGIGVLGQMLWGSVTNYLWINANFSVHFGLEGKVLFRSRIGSLRQKDKNTGKTTTTANAAGSKYFEIGGFAGVTVRL